MSSNKHKRFHYAYIIYFFVFSSRVPSIENDSFMSPVYVYTCKNLSYTILALICCRPYTSFIFKNDIYRDFTEKRIITCACANAIDYITI